MALKEGRCPNCGSILMLDPQQDKGHCLYCDAVFDNTKAFALSENLGDYVFPNEKQAKYEGPNLDPKQYQPRIDLDALQAKAEAQPSLKGQTGAPKLELSGQAIPDLKMPRKQVAIVAGIALLIAAIFLAVMIPVSLERDRIKAQLSASFLHDLELDPSVDAEKLLIRGNDNSQAVLLVKGEVSKEEAGQYFEKFCRQRAKLLELDPQTDDSKALYANVGMEVISTEGSWRIAPAPHDADQAYVISPGQ
ncbi:MAG: hypothetical protein SPK23_04080 [Eubacteriales bacterium]|nr:hypothetical protein [Clostridiales bacterium]MDY5836284.1 hypothetical protein [Eubacteriales bacterium]